MIKRRLCKEYLEEIERLERSIRELEDRIIELNTQLRMKSEEVTSLAIENGNLRYKLEKLEKRYNQLIELLKKMKIPFIIIDEDEFEKDQENI
ncbi:hypothetical protein A3L04_02450 [Thermococcus chitonophagus]|uniref:Cell division protein ZapB n=1 Tax=Thermococcus chitonophagus TaxID=54262 RepID=A0A161JXF0_9EURY|nr:hypothetical protein [Thermococcus chitonophagus]ASJ16017.1 hypothetical protein A3L04_02450 [Thermococcus chitonophagus]CUX77264.1 hypothetical protein CHITON_0485 [Thermococcus chitonophagus]